MAVALGEEVISLLADRSTLAIARRPRTDTVWVFRRGEKWKDTTLKISNEAIDRFIAAVGEYHGIPISDANPSATVRLPKEVFQKAKATIMVPPVTPDGTWVIINTARGVAELEAVDRERKHKYFRGRPLFR
jgi:type IV secretory pathway ATPase VirB11/archaellum biosynthesis ATPase